MFSVYKLSLGSSNLIRKYSESKFEARFKTTQKTVSEVLGSLHYSVMKSSGACRMRGHGTPDVAWICTRYRMRHVPCLYVM